MRYASVLLLFFVYVYGFAQNDKYAEMSESARNHALLKLNKKVIMETGPAYYRTDSLPKIEGPFVFDAKAVVVGRIPEDFGRKYYTITINYDRKKERLEYHCATKVHIWADTGAPIDIFFGCGVGYNFLHDSYQDWGKKKYPQMQYQSYYTAPELMKRIQKNLVEKAPSQTDGKSLISIGKRLAIERN